jgi:hypothetical protein
VIPCIDGDLYIHRRQFCRHGVSRARPFGTSAEYTVMPGIPRHASCSSGTASGSGTACFKGTTLLPPRQGSPYRRSQRCAASALNHLRGRNRPVARHRYRRCAECRACQRSRSPRRAPRKSMRRILLRGKRGMWRKLCDLHAESCELCDATTCGPCFPRHLAWPQAKPPVPWATERYTRSA